MAEIEHRILTSFNISQICDVAYADAEEHEGEDSVRGTVRETQQGAQSVAAIQTTAVCPCYKSSHIINNLKKCSGLL
jgi:hypothetical protein